MERHRQGRQARQGRRRDLHRVCVIPRRPSPRLIPPEAETRPALRAPRLELHCPADRLPRRRRGRRRLVQRSPHGERHGLARVRLRPEAGRSTSLRLAVRHPRWRSLADLSSLATARSLQVFYASKDGTRVPMHLAHSKSLDLSKPHPTLLFAYGGFAWTQGALPSPPSAPSIPRC